MARISNTPRINKTQEVLKHLKRGWPLTSIEAFQMWRATRLAAIIHNLRKRHAITSTERRTADGTVYAEYRYAGELGGQDADGI